MVKYTSDAESRQQRCLPPSGAPGDRSAVAGHFAMSPLVALPTGLGWCQAQVIEWIIVLSDCDQFTTWLVLIEY